MFSARLRTRRLPTRRGMNRFIFLSDNSRAISSCVRGGLDTKLSDSAHEGVRLQPRRDGRVRCSACLGRVRNLIHTPQEYIRVTEIREDRNSTLRGQSCRSTPRANANERNANTATGTSVPHSVTNIHGAGKGLAIAFGCSLLGKPHYGLPVECVIR